MAPSYLWAEVSTNANKSYRLTNMILAMPNQDWNAMTNATLKFERDAFLGSPDRVCNSTRSSLISR